MRPAHRLAAAAACGLVLAGLAAGVVAANPDALWRVVHGRCVPGAQAGDPAPCTAVWAHDAVLKDRHGATQYLVIPLARVTGIEDPAVLAPDTPNYFADAWAARRFVAAKAGRALARGRIVLAINARAARTQDQLHIHVDCIRDDVRATLAKVAAGPGWVPLPERLAGQRYLAMRLEGEALPNPFGLLANGVSGARAAMGGYTLVVAGVPGGFVLLAGRADEGGGHGEDLQDHRCGSDEPARHAGR